MNNIIGNSANAGRRPVSSGSGASHKRTPFGHLTVGGAAGDVRVFDINEIFQGFTLGTVLIQTTGGSINVYRTLADIDLAASPIQNPWTSEVDALAPGIIYESSVGTAFKIEFLGAAVVYIAGV